MQRLDDICERKRIVRDSFFNRLFFLLAADHEHRTHLFFDGDWGWLHGLMEHSDFPSSAAGDFVEAIPDFRDPFFAIRAACELPEYQGPDPIYIAPITADDFLRHRSLRSERLSADELSPAPTATHLRSRSTTSSPAGTWSPEDMS